MSDYLIFFRYFFEIVETFTFLWLKNVKMKQPQKEKSLIRWNLFKCSRLIFTHAFFGGRGGGFSVLVSTLSLGHHPFSDMAKTQRREKQT